MDKTLNFKGKKIHYRTEGMGDTIVLLHGFTESLEMWKYFSYNLSGAYNVISVDLPGHGASETISEVHTMELMAEVVKSVLEKENISKCTMIGHSMGGYVTLAFAANHPGFLKGIGLFHSSATADNEVAKNNRDRTIRLVENDKAGFIAGFIPSLFAPANVSKYSGEIAELTTVAKKMTVSGIVAALKGMKVRTEKLSLLRNINLPVLFILGKEDPRISIEIALEQVKLPAYCSVTILGNTGHMGFIEAKEKTLHAVDCFLKNFPETNNSR